MSATTLTATALTALAAIALGVAAFVGTPATGRTDGTADMAERLKKVAADVNPRLDVFRNRERVAMIEATMREKPAEATNPPLLHALATELLNSGRTADAITRYGTIESLMRDHGVPANSRPWRDLQFRKAVASLRLAEDDNCRLHHNAKSCLFPLREEGVHREKRGARAAIEILDGLLADDPGDLRARWLLNIAHMAIGDYPSGVPPRALIPPERFASEADIGPFPDIAALTGLDVDDGAGGVIADDFDGDDDLDLVASALGVTAPLRYFRNDGGRFVEATEAAGLFGEDGGLNIVQTDYDNDGRPDVLVLRGGWMGKAGHYPNSLLHNDGGGHFTDVTVEAGLLSYHPTQTGAWSDFDGDGWLDLYIGNESTEGDPNPSELYMNDRDGTFTECAAPAGVDVIAFVKGVTAGDYNDDGRPDLYLSIRGEANRLYRNDGPARGEDGRPGKGPCALRFTEVAKGAGVTGPIFSFPTWFFDYDNDGHEDLFVSGYMIRDVGDVAADVLGLPTQGETPRLYHNRGDGTFEDVTRATGLARVVLTMGSNFGDLDNDGWLDMHLGTGDPDLGTLVPNRTFRNDGGRRFQDITTSAGLGHLQKGHAVAFADFDDDGDLDLYEVIGGAFEADRFRNALYENPGQGNTWVEVELEGVRANRPGIGARLRLVAATPRGSRTICRTLTSGGSFGASPLRAWFGLGDATSVVSLEIRWPGSGTTQVLRGLRCGQRYRVREGDAAVVMKPRTPVRLGADRQEQVADGTIRH